MVASAPDETWRKVDEALRLGERGLPMGFSLSHLFGYWHRSLLTLDQVLAWGNAHVLATGRWPTRRSGSIRGLAAENWQKIDANLRDGHRGLPAGLSVKKLFAQRRLPRAQALQLRKRNQSDGVGLLPTYSGRSPECAGREGVAEEGPKIWTIVSHYRLAFVRVQTIIKNCLPSSCLISRSRDNWARLDHGIGSTGRTGCAETGTSFEQLAEVPSEPAGRSDIGPRAKGPGGVRRRSPDLQTP